MSLDLGAQVLLLMLQRVHDGHITEFCGGYFDEDRRISGPAVSGLAALVETGSLERRSSRTPELENSPRIEDHVGLSVAEQTRRVRLTERGLAKYKALQTG